MICDGTMSSDTTRLGSGAHGFFTSVDDVIKQYARNRDTTNVPLTVQRQSNQDSQARAAITRPQLVQDINSIRPDIKSSIIRNAIINNEVSQGRNGSILFRGEDMAPFITTNTDLQRRDSLTQLMQQLHELQRILQQRSDQGERLTKRRRVPPLQDQNQDLPPLSGGVRRRRHDGRFASQRT